MIKLNDYGKKIISVISNAAEWIRQLPRTLACKITDYTSIIMIIICILLTILLFIFPELIITTLIGFIIAIICIVILNIMTELLL